MKKLKLERLRKVLDVADAEIFECFKQKAQKDNRLDVVEFLNRADVVAFSKF